MSIAMVKHMGGKRCLEREWELKRTQGGIDYGAQVDDVPLPPPVTSGVPLPRKDSASRKETPTVAGNGQRPPASAWKSPTPSATKPSPVKQPSSSLAMAGMTEEEQIAQ